MRWSRGLPRSKNFEKNHYLFLIVHWPPYLPYSFNLVPETREDHENL